MKARGLWTTFIIAAYLLTGCAELNGILAGAGKGQFSAPKVALGEVTLAQAPSERALTAYFCPKVVNDRFHLGVAGELLCSQFFGRVPDTGALKVAFDVKLNVANPNRVPLPLSSVLTAVTVYPGAKQSELGAACASLCSPEDPQCGGHDPNACPTGATDITRRDDVARALGKMVIAEGVRLASGQPVGIKPPQVTAGSSVDVVVRLSLDPQQLLPLLEQFASQAAQQLRDGKQLDLSIPYNISGTLFTGPMGTAGVLSAPFGPVSGAWELR